MAMAATKSLPRLCDFSLSPRFSLKINNRQPQFYALSFIFAEHFNCLISNCVMDIICI